MSDTLAAEGASRAPGSVQPGLINRRELVDALTGAARKPVTIISAPPGSGKTSLLKAWAGEPGRDGRIAFLTVRPGQHDAQRFWLALLGAIRTATGDTEALPDIPGFNGPAMVERVLSELAAVDGRAAGGRAADGPAGSGPFVLIIDDLHELASAEAVGGLAALLTDLPRGVHAIVATRRDLPLRLHRLRLIGGLAEIRAAQLRFTEDETRELLTGAGIRLSDQAAATLHQRTEGWAAGLRLAALSLAGHPDPDGFVAEFSGSDRTVAEYLLAEMLDRQSPEVLRLLLRTSLLDRVNGELADLLTGTTGSERILLELEDANAFVVSLDSGRAWFRYHRMFGDLLRLELRRTAHGEIPELHRLAARWLGVHARPADAIRHLQAAGNWDEAARMLTDHALSLSLDGQAGTVAALLRAFPTEARRGSPDLALVRAVANLDQLHLDLADAHLEAAKAYAATTPPDRRHRLRLAIASLSLYSARLRAHFDGVFGQVGALLSPVDGQTVADVALNDDLRADALLNLGVTEAWSLRLLDSVKHLLEGAALARHIGRPYLEVACLSHLGFASTIQSFTLARQRCEEALALAARHGWDADPVTAPALAALANALIWTGEFDSGEQWLARARDTTRLTGEPAIRLLVCLTAAMLPAARGDHRRALEEFAAAKRMQALMVGEHALTSRVTAWTIATQARLGRLDQARADLAALDDEEAAIGEIRNAAAAIRLAEQEPGAARLELRTVLGGTAPINSYLTLVESHLLDALACRDLGDERAAREAIERALDLAEPDRLILPFAMTGAWRLLEALPSQGRSRQGLPNQGPSRQRLSHAALLADILDSVRGGGSGRPPLLPAEELSPSELRVLHYLPTNLTRPEIAQALSVSLNTVNTHIRRIYAKLGASDRTSAVHRSRELRLLATGRT
jgi:LuxR family transcriptional regulator, maltose regulon positive regulatory protein